VGCLLCRSSLSVDLVAQPPPAAASGEAVTSAPDPSCHKKARREKIGGDLGHIEYDRCSPWLELVMTAARAEDPVRSEVPADAVPSPATAPEADSTPAGDITPAEAATPPPPATEDITVGNDAATHASSNPPSQEGMRQAAAGATEEAPVRARSLEPLGLAAQTPSSLELMPSV
jgi:hypothetical protein